MKRLITIIIFIIIINFILPTSQAKDSTPSADIRTKLEELKKDIASKAAKLKQEVDRKLKDKAYIGTVKSKSDTSLTLAAQSGPKIVSLNEDTVFENQVKPKSKQQKVISLEDFVVALGDTDETGVLTAKKIIMMPAPTTEPKTFLWGQVISISDQLITIKGADFKNTAVSLSSPVKLNNFVILTGKKGKNDIFQADFVYVIPQAGILRPKKISTASAQTATSSATPKPNSR